MDEELRRRFEDDVRRMSWARAAAEERACEAALVGGTCGVLIDADGARPDARVPYGELWHYPHGVL